MKKIIFICLFIFICFNLSFALSWYDVLQDENFSSLNNKIDSSYNYLLFLLNNLCLSELVNDSNFVDSNSLSNILQDYLTKSDTDIVRGMLSDVIDTMITKSDTDIVRGMLSDVIDTMLTKSDTDIVRGMLSDVIDTMVTKSDTDIVRGMLSDVIDIRGMLSDVIDTMITKSDTDIVRGMLSDVIDTMVTKSDIDNLKNMLNIDTLFLQISNSDTIYADSSISGDTLMYIVNDTACLVIYGDSYGINLSNYDFSYKVKINNRYWVESSLYIYYDEQLNRIVMKSDIFTFSPNTIRINLYKVK